MTLRDALIFAVAIAAGGACTSSPSRPVPRPTAYPRPQIYPGEYVRADSLPLSMDVNAHAVRQLDHRDDGSVWLTLSYPAYNAKIYCTFTPVDERTVSQVVDNRTERISLNSRDTAPRIWSAQNTGGQTITIVEASTISTTPLQFISFDTVTPKWVVSGTVFLDGLSSDAQPDSVSPTVDALGADLRTMLSSLGK